MHDNEVVCPFCHACLHLDETGVARAGTMIWIKEIPQAHINLMCVVIFHAIISKSIDEAALERMMQVYRILESRTAPLMESLVSAQAFPNVCDPSFFAQQMERRPIPQDKMTGIRLLPAPAVFGRLIRAWGPHIEAVVPSSTWQDLALPDCSLDLP